MVVPKSGTFSKPKTSHTTAAVSGSKSQRQPEPPAVVSQNRLEEQKETKALMNSCHFKKPGPVALESIPFGPRLNIRRRTKLERDTARVRNKPRGFIPRVSMPNWSTLAPDKKLTYISVPKAVIPYSRGVVGEELTRKTAHFHLDDPNNYEMGVSLPYDAFHDPNLADYYGRPRAHKFLADHELITKDNFVIEDVNRMNKYRQYLFRTVYGDDLKAALNDRNESDRHFNKQLAKINKFVRNSSEGKGPDSKSRIERVQKEKLKDMTQTIKRVAESQMAAEQRLIELHARREQEHYRQKVKNYERVKEQQKRLFETKRKEKQAQVELCSKIAIVDREATERIKTDREKRDQTSKQLRMEAFNAKRAAQRAKIDQIKMLEMTLNDAHEHRGLQRQHEIEKKREALPALIAKKKAREKHRMELARKYFDRWRAYVIERRDEMLDEFHVSLWDVEEDVDRTLEYLQKKSGYEKLDNFVFNIVMLKRRIQEQLSMAEGEGEGDGDEPDVHSIQFERSPDFENDP